MSPRAIHIYNLGTDETVVVDDSIADHQGHLGVDPGSSTPAGGAAGPATAR